MNGRLMGSLKILIAVMAVSGLAHYYLKHFTKTDDPFAVVNHPLEPVMQKIHILAAPLFLFAMGAMARSHILDNGRRRENGRRLRKSGVIAMIVLPFMVLSGYALQVIPDAALLDDLALVHLAVGLAFVAVFSGHWLSGRR